MRGGGQQNLVEKSSVTPDDSLTALLMFFQVNSEEVV